MHNQKQKIIIVTVLLFLGIDSLVHCNVTSGELQALNDIYESTQGKYWLNATNWLNSDPCNNHWYGVECTNGHVTSLTLSLNNLYGTIEASISNLYALEELVLNDNAITGTIPTTLNQIRSLGKINFHSNLLSSQIPNNLGDLLDYNLEYLDLSSNKLVGAIPNFFNNPPTNFYANLSDNLFACPIPSWATYTEANCVQWIMKAIEPLCAIPGEDVNIFGDNFQEVDGLTCDLYNTTSNKLVGRSTAKVLSNSLIICQTTFNFTQCNANVGSRTFEVLTLKLSLEGSDVTGNTSQSLSLINYSCQFGNYLSTTNGAYFLLPTLTQVLNFCSYHNPTPYYCPSVLPSSSSSTRYVPSVLDTSCSNQNSNSSCNFAMPIDSPSIAASQSCHYYSCYYSSSCAFYNYCYNYNKCYAFSNECSCSN